MFRRSYGSWMASKLPSAMGLAAMIAKRRFPFAIADTLSLSARFFMLYSVSSIASMFSAVRGSSSISLKFR